MMKLRAMDMKVHPCLSVSGLPLARQWFLFFPTPPCLVSGLFVLFRSCYRWFRCVRVRVCICAHWSTAGDWLLENQILGPKKSFGTHALKSMSTPFQILVDSPNTLGVKCLFVWDTLCIYQGKEEEWGIRQGKSSFPYLMWVRVYLVTAKYGKSPEKLRYRSVTGTQP